MILYKGRELVSVSASLGRLAILKLELASAELTGLRFDVDGFRMSADTLAALLTDIRVLGAYDIGVTSGNYG